MFLREFLEFEDAPNDIQQVFEKYDKDGDGNIVYQEFSDAIRHAVSQSFLRKKFYCNYNVIFNVFFMAIRLEAKLYHLQP